MSLKSRLLEDLTTAMKARDSRRVSVLRMVKAEILKKEVSLRADKGLDYELDDAETLQVLSSYAKARRQSIEAYRQAGRADLQAAEEAELAMLESYLPKQLSEEELADIVDAAISETGATEMHDMGAVMKVVMARAGARVDGKLASQIVRIRLLAADG